MNMKATYKPEVFNVSNEQDAKNIILTAEGVSTEERWEKETPFLAKDIGEFLQPTKDSLILDFGCGIGRISKALIQQYNCRMLGLDISQSMRALSAQYVAHDHFSAIAKPLLKNLIKNGLKVDACVALWVLQHCPRLEEEIALIKSILKKDGHLYVLNNNSSAIPTDKGWVNDGSNIKNMLEKNFKLVSYSKLPIEHAPKGLAQNTFIAKLQY